MINPDEYVPTNYLPVLIMLIIAILFGLGGLIFGSFVRPRFFYKEKLLPYECGNEPSSPSYQKIVIMYYPFAVLFVVFDVEVALLYPWAYSFSSLNSLGFWSVLIFILIILLGYLYDLQKEIIK